MKQSRTIILYLFITLIIIVGLFLFIFKDWVADKFLNYNTEGQVINVYKPSSDLKLDILKDARIKALKNYVNIFNNDDLDASQTIILANFNKQSDVVIANPDGVASTTPTSTKNIIRVRVGNSNPFLVNKAAK